MATQANWWDVNRAARSPYASAASASTKPATYRPSMNYGEAYVAPKPAYSQAKDSSAANVLTNAMQQWQTPTTQPTPMAAAVKPFTALSPLVTQPLQSLPVQEGFADMQTPVQSALKVQPDQSMFDGVKSWWRDNKDFLIGDKNSPGAIPTGLGLATGLFNMYSGVQGLKLAKDSFAESMRRYHQEYANQGRLVNQQLSDKEKDRASASGISYSDPRSQAAVAGALEKYGVKNV